MDYCESQMPDNNLVIRAWTEFEVEAVWRWMGGQRWRNYVAASAAEQPSHDYHGPTRDGKSVPDEAHERFHGGIGDVIQGKIIRPARDQMRDALDKADARDRAAPAAERPMPRRALGGKPQAVGL